MRPFALFVVLLLTCSAFAHPPQAAIAQVKLARDGHVEIVIDHDVLAFALVETPTKVTDEPMYRLLRGPDSDLDEALVEARERMLDQLKLLADARAIPLHVDETPTRDAIRAWQKRTPGENLPLRLRFVAVGNVPLTTKTITLEFPPLLDDVIISFEHPGAEALVVPLKPGESSPEFNIALESDAPAKSLSAFDVAVRFARIGFEHIIPQGLDHVCFVLGLFLLAPRLKTVLWQITAFTIAHTITLTLTSLHVIGLPSSIVEPTIAASIVFIGIENLCTKDVHPWRIGVAFVFGLVHGMGVATAFNEAGFPPGQLVTSLAAFTIGVEAGHLVIVAAAFLTLGWWAKRDWFRRRVTVPLSCVIAAVGLFWLVQRVM